MSGKRWACKLRWFQKFGPSREFDVDSFLAEHSPDRRSPAIRSALRAYRWLTVVAPRETDEMRAWMLAVTASQVVPILIGSFAATATAVTVVYLTSASWPIYWIAAEWLIALPRLALVSRLTSTRQTSSISELHAGLLTGFGLAWSLLYGLAAYACMASGKPALMALAAFNVAGAAGIIATRNSSTPRYGIVVLSLATSPFVVAANQSPQPGMPLLAFTSLALILGAISLLLQNNKLLVRAYRAERRAHVLATTDPLTGLLNRKGLKDALKGLTVEWTKGTSPTVSCLYLDLDGFKAVNDSFGHGAGDRLLTSAGARMASAVRRTDLVYRLGGDEFLILAPGTDEAAAADLAKRIVSAFNDPFERCASLPIHVGISIGGATSRPGGISPKDAVGMADECLYVAKRDGKARYRTRSAP